MEKEYNSNSQEAIHLLPVEERSLLAVKKINKDYDLLIKYKSREILVPNFFLLQAAFRLLSKNRDMFKKIIEEALISLKAIESDGK